MKKFKKLLSVILAVMMVMSVMPVGATGGATGGAGGTAWPNIPDGATLIFAEDFESGFDTGVNFLGTNSTYTFEKNGKKAITITRPSDTATGYAAMVTTADGFDGNVLYLENSNYNSNSNETASNIKYDFFFNGGEAVDFTSQSSPYYGKQLVYEFEAKIANLKERQFMKLDSSVASPVAGSGVIAPFQKASGNGWSLRNGPWETRDGLTRPWYLTQSIAIGNKSSLKVVFDQTGNVDVLRTYKDGVLQKIDRSTATVSGAGQNWNGKIVKDFVGEYFRGETDVNMSAPKSVFGYVTPSGSGKTASIYLDNIVVYAVDSINFDGFESATAINPENGVKVKFDQPFNADKNTFRITDMAGAEVANAITAVEMSNDKLTATVKMDFGTLEPTTQYKVWVDDEFVSEAGALFYTNSLGIAEADEWIELSSFETCAKLDVEITPASGSISDYDKGDDAVITLRFSTPLAETVDFENAFVVTDENGTEIEGLFVALNGDRTEGSLDLTSLALGQGLHTIKSKQGAIYNASNITASITYTFDTVDFNATATPASIPQYIAGAEENSKVVVALTAATTLTNDNIITGFEVVDQAGNPVNGLAVSLDDTSKIVTLDIKNMALAPGKYYIKSTENLVDRRNRQLIDAVNVSFKVVTELSNATLIIEDDFEADYPVGTNWLEGVGSSISIPTADGGKWAVSGANGADNFMGVVDGTNLKDNAGNSLGFDSNVLKVSAGTATALTFWRKPLGDTIDVAAQGKILIYEFDTWADGNSAEHKWMAIDTNSNNGFQKLSGTNYPASTGVYWDSSRDADYSKWYARSNLNFANKSNVKIIVDQTGNVDSMRFYQNGQVVKAKYSAIDPLYANYGKTAYDFYGENYVGGATLDYGPFEGIYTYLKGKNKATTFYIDNLKVYTVDKLEFVDVDWGNTSSAAFNPDTGLTINFSDKIRAEELKNELIVTDAQGNNISAAVKSVELKNDEKSAKVKFDFSRLEKFTEYNVNLNFLFRSKDGAYIARDGIVDGGNVLIANFTTGDKLETTVTPASISGYDKGVDKTVEITLSSALKADITDIAGLFEVKDEAGNVIEGLQASISEDRKTITLQLSGLALGDGQHIISTKENAMVNDAGVAGSATVVVNTIAFAGVASPAEGGIANYIEGSTQKINVLLTLPTLYGAANTLNAFIVEDENGAPVSGLGITLSEDKKAFTLDLSTLTLGVGKHTIKSTDAVVDSRGRALGFTYEFSILPFYAEYTNELLEYAPGTEKAIEIKVTYPLSDSSVANAANAFVVKNQYGSNVSGLGVTVSEDKKTIALNLATLDIEGGDYVITSKTGAFTNVKGEVLADMTINLSTSAAVVEGTPDTGVGPNAGSEMTGDFTSTVLLSENFDDEGYTRDVNWLASQAFVPAGFALQVVGNGDKYVDASVSIVEDPVNAGNYVLKNVAGFRDASGSVMANSSNYHRVKRYLDSGVKESIPVDDYTIVKLSTKVYIPADGGTAGIPTGDNNTTGNTKDVARIIALASDTGMIGHANLRKNSGGVAQFNSWINSGETAAEKTGSVSMTLSSGTWHTIEIIFGNNLKNSGTKFKSYEVWVDGVKCADLGGYYGADYSVVDGMASVLASATGGSGTTTVYYDDWSIMKSVRLGTHINVPKTDVTQTQVVKLQLTSKLTDDSVALIESKGLITLKDSEGNDVKATIDVDNTGTNTKIVITPEYGLKYQTDYAVEIAENYVDERGNVTAIKDEMGSTFGGFTYNFETAKALGNTIDVDNGTLTYDADYMHNEDTFNYTMALKEAAATDIIGAVATFSDTNELLGIDYQVFTSGDTSKAFTVSSELGAKYLRLFIWEKNPDGTMGRLMQIPDEVTSR